LEYQYHLSDGSLQLAKEANGFPNRLDMQHRWLARHFLTAFWLIGFSPTAGFALEQPKLVIVDDDFNGPPWSLTNQRAALMFLESPEVKVLGFTVVTGDGWRDEEVSHLLRLLEIAGHPDIPVVPGAV
jgi:purine nucleosidase